MSTPAHRVRPLLALLALPATASYAQAQVDSPPQSEPSPEARAAAKERFLRGLSSAKAGEWASALPEFVESARLFPTRAALNNVALSLSNLGRNVEAISAYDEVLRRFGASIDAGELSSLRATREELMTRVGELAVESEPGGASVSWNGREVGVTPLAPILVDTGMHTIEVSKPGHVTFKKTFSVAAKQLLTVQATLGTQGAEGNIAARPARGGPAPAGPAALRETGHAYFELMGGLALASSFGGGADASCDESVADPTDPTSGNRPACSDRSRPFGLFAGARGGYAVTSHLGVELFLGYLSVHESLVRRLALKANADATTLYSGRYEDSAKIRGPVTALSVSYALLRDFPVVARAWVGLTVVNVSTSNFGSYVATEGDPEPQSRSVPEADQRAWIPFVGPEIQVGYPLGKKLQLGLSLAAFVAFAPETPRAGTSEGRRLFTSVSPLGTFVLPREDALGTFVVFVPNVWLRAGF
ncbi:MAG TPA: PEGA domain-containing protein [Polyangiaceae bacterium]|nr:PEGA domain-containing protein [Polyangiaceae bacterium]